MQHTYVFLTDFVLHTAKRLPINERNGTAAQTDELELSGTSVKHRFTN